MANGQRPRTGLLILGVFLALSIVGQAVPLYTDWLWFDEVGYAGVFTTILTLRGWLVLIVGAVVFAFLFLNLRLAARSAPPDVLWELEDQLSLPGRAVVEPLIRRLLVPVLAVLSLVAGVRASAAWETIIEYRNAVPFGRTDPLFGHDLAFYVFELPFWRIVYGWGMTLVMGTLVLTTAVYVLQRSVVLTAQGPRLAAGARTHLLLLGGALLLLRAAGFRLDQYELLYSARGVVFGASYTDVHATLPVLRVLMVLAVLCAVVCAWQARRASWRPLLAGLVVLAVVWVGGLGLYPTLLQRLRVTPNELVAERPYIEHNIRMTRQAYGLDKVQEKPFPAEENLNAAALDRNALTIKNIRLWDHRPLLTTFGQLHLLQVPRRRQRPLHAGRRVPPGDALAPRAVVPAPPRPGPELDQRAPHLYPRLRARRGTGESDQPGGAARVLRQGHPPGGRRLSEDHAAGDLLRRGQQRLRLRPHPRPGAGLPLRRAERLHPVRGPGRGRGERAAAQAGLRHPVRRGQDPAVRRPHPSCSSTGTRTSSSPTTGAWSG
jgi:hypothetical protein